MTQSPKWQTSVRGGQYDFKLISQYFFSFGRDGIISLSYFYFQVLGEGACHVPFYVIVIVAPTGHRNWLYSGIEYFTFWCPLLRCFTRETWNFVRKGLGPLMMHDGQYCELSPNEFPVVARRMWHLKMTRNCYNSTVLRPICDKLHIMKTWHWLLPWACQNDYIVSPRKIEWSSPCSPFNI